MANIDFWGEVANRAKALHPGYHSLKRFRPYVGSRVINSFAYDTANAVLGPEFELVSHSETFVNNTDAEQKKTFTYEVEAPLPRRWKLLQGVVFEKVDLYDVPALDPTRPTVRMSFSESVSIIADEKTKKSDSIEVTIPRRSTVVARVVLRVRNRVINWRASMHLVGSADYQVSDGHNSTIQPGQPMNIDYFFRIMPHVSVSPIAAQVVAIDLRGSFDDTAHETWFIELNQSDNRGGRRIGTRSVTSRVRTRGKAARQK